MNQYEIAVLYHPDLEVDLTKAEERVKKIVTDNGGKVTTADNWGKRKLASLRSRRQGARHLCVLHRGAAARRQCRRSRAP